MSLILVTGATGFVGRALLPVLTAAGHSVRATTRDVSRVPKLSNVEWRECDLQNRDQVAQALKGVEAAYFLVHAMGSGRQDYADTEQRAAYQFQQLAAAAGVRRIVYLGGVAPSGKSSEHLKSRLHVGDELRAGAVPTLELRASMIIGNGSASWRIVRDLAMRLPAMVLPSWTKSRTRPIALEDVVVALVRGLDVPLQQSAIYDLPGPDMLSGWEILERIAHLRGRHIPAVPVPFLSVGASSWWLKLITREDFFLARELVLGFTGDLLPTDERYWDEIQYHPVHTFDAAAKRALDEEEAEFTLRGVLAQLEEAAVHYVGTKLRSR
ncbi:MAG: NAD(P)H-binding protein [Myxococcaceae bacterium]